MRLSPKSERILNRRMKESMDFYIQFFRNELKAQGHYDTGKLDQSFKVSIVKDTVGKVVSELFFEEHGFALDTGVPKGNVRYKLENIVEWVMSKLGIADQNEAMRVAAKIRNSHKKHGIPTPLSTRDSRLGWLSKSVSNIPAQNKAEAKLKLDEFMDSVLDDVLEKYIKK